MSGNTGSRGPRRVFGRPVRRGLSCPVGWGLLLFLSSMFLLLPLSGAAADKGSGVRVLLRYDDYTRTSSFALEDKLFRALDRMDVPVLVGAVPFPGAHYPEISATPVGQKADIGPEKIALLRELTPRRNIELALHGYSHHNTSADGKDNSEFAGLPFDRQRQLLMLGKSAFEAAFGVPVRTFIPPYNAYDDSTVRALERTGFAVLSADVRPAPADASVALVPGTAHPQKMKQAIQNALHEKSGASLVVIVMHNYDFVEDAEPIPAFRKIRSKIDSATLLEDIRWAKQQPGLTFVSVEDLLRAREDLSAARVASNESVRTNWMRSHALLPAGLTSSSSDGMLMTTSRADEVRGKEYALGIAIYASLFLVVYALSRRLNRATPLRAYKSVQRKLALAMGASLALFSYLHGFYLSEAMLLVSVTGWYLGVAAQSRADRMRKNPSLDLKLSSFSRAQQGRSSHIQHRS